MSPFKSDDLTKVIERYSHNFVVLWSPETAEDGPEYCELGRFRTEAEAQAFLESG